MNWGQLSALLPYLLALACPLSMFWMMRMMAADGARGQKGRAEQDFLHPAPLLARSTAEEVRGLKERLNELEARRPEWTGPG